MSSILGESGSLQSFLNFISPLLNLVYKIISVELFGMPFWTILLNFLLVFFVIGFIKKGSVGIGSSTSSAVRGYTNKNKDKE